MTMACIFQDICGEEPYICMSPYYFSNNGLTKKKSSQVFKIGIRVCFSKDNTTESQIARFLLEYL